MSFIELEVRYRLRNMFFKNLRQPQSASDFLREIDELKRSAFDRLAQLESEVPSERSQNIRCRITEIFSVFISALRNPSSVVFGTGIGMAGCRFNGEIAMSVQEVHEGGPAHEAGIRVGDIITHIDGRKIGEFSTDGTVEGLRDPKLSMLRGFGGPLNSIATFTIFRKKSDGGWLRFTVSVPRTALPGATSLCGKPPRTWDGEPPRVSNGAQK